LKDITSKIKWVKFPVFVTSPTWKFSKHV
jgi:hypothetical protein